MRLLLLVAMLASLLVSFAQVNPKQQAAPLPKKATPKPAPAPKTRTAVGFEWEGQGLAKVKVDDDQFDLEPGQLMVESGIHPLELVTGQSAYSASAFLEVEEREELHIFLWVLVAGLQFELIPRAELNAYRARKFQKGRSRAEAQTRADSLSAAQAIEEQRMAEQKRIEDAERQKRADAERARQQAEAEKRAKEEAGQREREQELDRMRTLAGDDYGMLRHGQGISSSDLTGRLMSSSQRISSLSFGIPYTNGRIGLGEMRSFGLDYIAPIAGGAFLRFDLNWSTRVAFTKYDWGGLVSSITDKYGLPYFALDTCEHNNIGIVSIGIRSALTYRLSDRFRHFISTSLRFDGYLIKGGDCSIAESSHVGQDYDLRWNGMRSEDEFRWGSAWGIHMRIRALAVGYEMPCRMIQDSSEFEEKYSIFVNFFSSGSTTSNIVTNEVDLSYSGGALPWHSDPHHAG
jgi:hypothetical protein